MPEPSPNERLRNLPSVDDVLENTYLDRLRSMLPHQIMVASVRGALESARKKLLDGQDASCNAASLAQTAEDIAEQMLNPSIKRVVNATGVIIHTNLGRSVLAETAVSAVTEAARGYSTLEYDIAHMSRGSRHDHCEKLICALTGAGGAIAVNNNAAAVLLVLSEFAAGHEAVVSRGELIEIGGSFRIPDIMSLSHAHMVEVGTTNKTHASDYEKAITDDTAMLLKVHTSNYRLIGFTESVAGHDLRIIADSASQKRRSCDPHAPGIIVYEDLGSGALISLPVDSEHAEPTAAEALEAGCDLVSFSGDKLLGGPQAGIVIGSAELIERLKKNPLARTMRLDKMTLAALEATLRLYLTPDRAQEEIPTLRMLEAPADTMKSRAALLAERIEKNIPAGCARIEVVPEVSRSGGGSLPMYDIDTFAVQMSFNAGCAQECEEFLIRENHIPVIARIKQEMVLFDVRTILDDEEQEEIANALAGYFEKISRAETGESTASKGV